MEGYVKGRMMTEYDVQEWKMRLETCDMTPRAQDMQPRYERAI